MAKNNKGGNLTAVAFLSELNVLLTGLVAYTNCAKFLDISKSGITTDISSTDFPSEDGINRDEDWSRVVKGNEIFMDREKAHLDFFRKTIDNQRLLKLKYIGIVGGKYVEVFSIVRGKGQINLEFPGANTSNKFEASCIAPTAAVTFSADDLTAIETALGIAIRATTVTIAANDELAIVETTV